MRDIDEELDELDDRTVVQLGQAASEDAGDRDKDDGGEGKGHAAAKGGKAPKGVKKSKDTGGTAAGGKGKQKPSATAKKTASGAAAPAAANKKKVLQGLLVLRPGGTGGGSWAAAAAPESSADDNASDGAATMPPLVVGRSSRQNDRVSFEVAKEHHLWFHVQVEYLVPYRGPYQSPLEALSLSLLEALSSFPFSRALSRRYPSPHLHLNPSQGSPGSHCLLQLDPGAKGRATEESLQFAADVAAYYSQARGSTQVHGNPTTPHARTLTPALPTLCGHRTPATQSHSGVDTRGPRLSSLLRLRPQVPVGYTSPKYVRRVSGGAPGMVSGGSASSPSPDLPSPRSRAPTPTSMQM